MKPGGMAVAMILAVSLAGCAAGKQSAVAGRAAESMQSAAKQGASSASPLPTTEELQLARGKELFIARCGSCHDADGSKPLRHGPPLNQRPLTDEAIAAQVGQRFRSATEEDKQAAIAYVRSFLKSSQ